MPVQPTNISNTVGQMFLDDESVFAPQERAQERQAKQNALAAARQQEMQANMLRNVVAQNIDPRTGRTNWQGAMASAPQQLLPQLQGLMGESEKAAAELAAKQATTRNTEMEGDTRYWQNQRNLAALPHTQESWSAWRETLPEWSREYVPEKFTPAAQQQVMRDAAAAIAEFNRQNLTAEQQSMAEDRAAQREISRGQLGVAQGNLAVNQAAEARLGAGSATADKNLAGKQQLSTIIDKMRGAYETLRTEGAAVQPGGDVLGNIGARIRGTGAAQAVEGAIGTKAQSERTKIKNMRPLLVNAIKQATGMSAQQMNSNVELKLFLDTATNPDTADIDANLAALENLNALYGLGLDVGSPPASAAPANSGGNGWGKATIKK